MIGALSDLHCHLDGSLRPETVRDLAQRQKLAVPSPLIFDEGMGLAAALARFEFTLSLLQEPASVARVASEMCEDATANGVTTLEIRFAPQLHKGASIEVIVDAALEGAAGRAGLILCGLYGEPPALLEELVRVAQVRNGVCGLDLAGGPSPAQRYSMVDYAPAFAEAARLGLGRTVHAAEGRSVQEIRAAVEVLGAQRIGHGTTLLDDPKIARLVIDRGITIEACIRSNVHTGAIKTADDHPLARWLALGVRACVNTDNTLLSDTDAQKEHDLARSLPGMTDELLQRAIEHGHAAAFER